MNYHSSIPQLSDNFGRTIQFRNGFPKLQTGSNPMVGMTVSVAVAVKVSLLSPPTELAISKATRMLITAVARVLRMLLM